MGGGKNRMENKEEEKKMDVGAKHGQTNLLFLCGYYNERGPCELKCFLKAIYWVQ
jgi:hypothetical protein